MARTAEVLWVLDHLDDIASDLSAFHRIDNYEQMGSVRFLRLAYRLPAYGGVMAVRQQEAERRDSRRRLDAPDPVTGERPTVIGSSAADLTAAFGPDVVEVGRG
jgi:hypothetical protein